MKNGRVVVLGDCHWPYVDHKAWDLALKIVQDLKPTVTVQIGDFCDLQSVSSHGKSYGRDIELVTEIRAAQGAWKQLEQAAGRELLFCSGNHDLWLQRYVAKNAPMIEALVPDFQDLYGMNRKRVAVAGYQEEYEIGNVRFTHDAGHAGKTAIQQTLDTVQHNVVFGHVHRLGVVYDGSSSGERRFAACAGWLGDPAHISYAPPARTRSWQHGLIVVEYAGGLSFASAVPFVKGRAFYNGKLYK